MSTVAGSAPVSGYPTTAARVIQAPGQRAAAPVGSLIAPINPRGPVIRSAASVVSAPVTKAAAPATGSLGQPASLYAPRSLAGQPASVPGVRQARVISGSGQGAGSPTAATVLSSTSPSVVSAAAPRVLTTTSASKSATVLSSGVEKPNSIGGPAYTQSAYEVKHKDDPQLSNLKELRKTCGLKNIPVNDALQTLKTMSKDGKLTREQFLGAYTLLLQQFQVEVPNEEVKNAVFDLFDRDDNGVVDMMEVICGASLLCTGSEKDKIQAVFSVFDENGDGVITMDEMFKFLTSVYKVVLTPNVMAVMNSMGVSVDSAEDLASVTALECFKTADLNNDAKLSMAEFENWFFAPRNDPSFLFSPVRKLLQ